MKAVLISIKPKWCELIASGKKTVEVRKTAPKLEPPFKCYIYCTKDPRLRFWRSKTYSYADDRSHNAFDRCGNGFVIGEFVCDKIMPFDVPYPAYQKELDKAILEQSCLTYYQLHRYAYHDILYGWHISDLVIYDEPKDLSQFEIECKGGCDIPFLYDRPCENCGKNKLTRPPQSWCYVEELNDG